MIAEESADTSTDSGSSGGGGGEGHNDASTGASSSGGGGGEVDTGTTDDKDWEEDRHEEDRHEDEWTEDDKDWEKDRHEEDRHEDEWTEDEWTDDDKDWEEDRHEEDRHEDEWTDDDNKDWDDNPWDDTNDTWTDDNSNENQWEDTWVEPAPQPEDCKRMKNDTRRVEREIRQLIKRFTKTGNSDYVSDLETLKVEINRLQDQITNCSFATWDEYHVVEQRLHGENSIQAEISWYRCIQDYERIVEDIEREEENLEREREDFARMDVDDDDLQKMMDDHLDRKERIIKLLKKQKELSEDNDCNFNSDPDLEWERQELWWDLEDLWDADHDFWRHFEKAKVSSFAKQVFGEILDYLKNNPCEATDQRCTAMEKTARQLIAKGQECLDDGKYRCTEEVLHRLEMLERKAMMSIEVDPGEFGMGEMEGVAMEVLKEVLEFDSAKLETIFSDPNLKGALSKMVRHIKLNETDIDNMEDWVTISDEIKETDKQFKNRVKFDKPLFGQAAGKFKENLEAYRDGTLDEEELKEQYEERIRESVKEEEKLGGFEDASFSNGDYWAEAVHNLELSGRVENGEKKYVPEGNTLVAEAFKIVLNAAWGQMDVERTDPWYMGYINIARNRGLDTSFVESSAGRAITRAEVLELIVKVNQMDYIPAHVPFTDVVGHRYYDAIATGYALGVTTGNPDGTFSPNGTINRADIATMANRMKENPEIISQTTTTEDYEHLVEDIEEFEDYEDRDDYGEDWEEDIVGFVTAGRM
jgi:hypothetical protein